MATCIPNYSPYFRIVVYHTSILTFIVLVRHDTWYVENGDAEKVLEGTIVRTAACQFLIKSLMGLTILGRTRKICQTPDTTLITLGYTNLRVTIQNGGFGLSAGDRHMVSLSFDRVRQCQSI